MDTQLVPVVPQAPVLELDVIADFACPWSYLGKRSLERALGQLYGAPARALRWHGLPLSAASAEPLSWESHLATRLPKGISVSDAQQSLAAAGEQLGIHFHFDRLKTLPDTREAHRLVRIAVREGRDTDVVDALFAAFFERGLDIASTEVLSRIARDTGLSEAGQEAFARPEEAADEVESEVRRLRSLGVSAVPNLLINGRILVPGPADSNVYVHALDQALFPQEEGGQAPARLH